MWPFCGMHYSLQRGRHERGNEVMQFSAKLWLCCGCIVASKNGAEKNILEVFIFRSCWCHLGEHRTLRMRRPQAFSSIFIEQDLGSSY